MLAYINTNTIEIINEIQTLIMFLYLMLLKSTICQTMDVNFGQQTFDKNGHNHTCKRTRYQLNEFHLTISSDPHLFPLFCLTISFVSPYQACSTISLVVFSTLHPPPPNCTSTSNSSHIFLSMHSFFQLMYFLTPYFVPPIL